jgi:predicted metal-dependent peptidase
MTPEQKIKDLIGILVLRDSFWGFLFSRVGKIEDEESLYPLGVGVMEDGMIYLFFNPMIISQMNDKDIEMGLMHEGIHIVSKHIPRLLRILADDTSNEKDEKEMAWNYAADFNANYMIGAPDSITIGETPCKLLKAPDYGFSNGETSEYYYYKLLEKFNKNKQQSQGSGASQPDSKDDSKQTQSSGNSKSDSKDDSQQNKSSENSQSESEDDSKQNQSSGNSQPDFKDDSQQNKDSKDKSDKSGQSDENKKLGHEKWITSSTKKIPDLQAFSRRVDQATKDIVGQSVSLVRNKGNIPGNLKELIGNCLLPPEIPYYMIIKKLIRGSRLAKYKMAYTKINRKRTYLFLTGSKKGLPSISPFPGKQKDTTFNISLISDTSGSMSKKDIEESLKGVKNIIENDRYCKTTVIQIDTQIRKEYVVKKIKDIDFEATGRGGTRLEPALLRAKELKTDVTLCFTDGGCDNINNIDRKLLPKKIIWVLTKDGITDMINKVGHIIRLRD